MNLQEDNDDYGRSGLRMPTVILVASAAIFVVLAIVLLANGIGKNNKKKPYTNTNTEVVEESATEEEKDTRTASDLNFWDMYSDPEKVSQISSNDDTRRKEELEEREALMNGPVEEEPEEEEIGPENDGKHTLVTHADGSSEWVAINSSLKLNTYEDTAFEKANGIVGYYINGKKTTKTGVDISQYTTEIGWDTLSSEVDYVMIRVGARGYDSGKIIADTKFIDNVCNATKSGIPFGVYFSSQAITTEEAKEELNYVLSQLTAAQSAVLNMSANSNTNTTNNNSNNTNNSTTNNSTSTNSSNISTTTNLVMGIPILSASFSKKASDGTNTTYMYTDGTAVTTYQTGEIVTAFSNGGMITNYSNGNVEKKDGAGNTITIDSKGNYTITNSSGTVTGSGTTTATTGLTSFQVVNDIPNNTTATVATNTTTNNSNNTNTTNNSTGNYTFKVSYPIAIDMHLIANDTARIESLNSADRTTIIKTFCEGVKTAGYSTLVYGDKEMLLTKLNLAELNQYNIWVGNEGDIPDYPYLMTMWKYDTTGRLIKSLNGDYGISTCFIDYATR